MKKSIIKCFSHAKYVLHKNEDYLSENRDRTTVKDLRLHTVPTFTFRREPSLTATWCLGTTITHL